MAGRVEGEPTQFRCCVAVLLVFGDAQKLLGGLAESPVLFGQRRWAEQAAGRARGAALGCFGLSVASKFVFSLARDSHQQKQAERTATIKQLARSLTHARFRDTDSKTADAAEAEHRFYGLLLAGICRRLGACCGPSLGGRSPLRRVSACCWPFLVHPLRESDSHSDTRLKARWRW